MQSGSVSQINCSHALLAEGDADALDEVCNHVAVKSTLSCAFQAQKHSRKCFSSARPRRVERTPDEKREVLRRFISERNSAEDKFNAQRWAKAAAISKNTLYNFLNGHNDALDHQTYRKLARAANVPVHVLTGEPPEVPEPSGIAVVGYVEAGTFSPAIEWDSGRWYHVDVPVPARFKSMAKALAVRGPSMNKEYPDGSVVVWVDQLDFRPAEHDDHVIVYAYSHDDEIEATVKELRMIDGQAWLWPLSDHPAHQLPIDPRNPPAHIARVEVKGIVLGGYKPRVH